jgi:hypothetical protein
MEFSDEDKITWTKLKEGHNALEMGEWLRTKDIDSNSIIKAGRMHIRYGSDEMIKHGAYNLNPNTINVHFDRFDVILNPALHFIFDTLYQGILGVN